MTYACVSTPLSALHQLHALNPTPRAHVFHSAPVSYHSANALPTSENFSSVELEDGIYYMQHGFAIHGVLLAQVLQQPIGFDPIPPSRLPCEILLPCAPPPEDFLLPFAGLAGESRLTSISSPPLRTRPKASFCPFRVASPFWHRHFPPHEYYWILPIVPAQGVHVALKSSCVLFLRA
ncbi:hypothetical protein BJ912DRAFT_922369 [Pholiota molesta]|nr:hypothetical protein BJ912DRAFT_922369 [Pholiota molesta]